jgi:hemerythrin-like domain-containing protein
MKAIQQLKDEHEGVKVMLGILERVGKQLEENGNLNNEHFGKILGFLTGFVDKCHHGKEEELLFPALEAAGVPKDGPIRVMLHEHELGRKYVRAMSDAFAGWMTGEKSASQKIAQNAAGYITLLRAHIEKENDVLFAMGDRLLTEKKQDELYEGFEKIEEERIGIGKHEEFHRLLESLSDIYFNQ